MKIKQEDGTEIDVFTQAEFEEKSKTIAEDAAKKAVEDFKKENPDKTKELEDLKQNLSDKEQELADAIKAGGNKEQIERLRKERDDAKKAESEGIASVKKELDDFKKEMAGETKDEALNRLSKGDAEVKKKLELEFDKYNPNDNSKKGIIERMGVAYKIVTGNNPAPDFMDNISNGGDKGGGHDDGAKGDKIERTDNEKKIGSTLGVADKDVENYEKFKADQKK